MANGDSTRAHHVKEWIAGLALGLAIAVSLYGTVGVRERLVRIETKVERFGEDLREMRDDFRGHAQGDR